MNQESQLFNQKSLRAVLGKSVNSRDLMLNAPMYGEGKTQGQVAELGIEATINQACAAVVVDGNKANRVHVKPALQANYLNMRELAEGGNQPNLNLSKVKEFEIPIPSLEDQAEIVCRVVSLFTLVDRIEARCTAANALAQRLSPLVLAKAFRGELVQQNPSDEPARELLARIELNTTATSEKEIVNARKNFPQNLLTARVTSDYSIEPST